MSTPYEPELLDPLQWEKCSTELNQLSVKPNDMQNHLRRSQMYLAPFGHDGMVLIRRGFEL